MIGGATGVVAGGLAARGRVTTFSETESMFGTRFNTGSGAVGDGRSVADNNCFFTSLAFVVGSDSDELAGQLGMQEGVVSVAQAGKAIRDLELGTGAPTIVNNAGDAYFNMTQVGGSDYEYLVGYEQNGNSVGHFINAIVDDGPVITFYDGQLGGQLRSLPLANRYTMFSISRTKIADVFGGITMMKP